MYIYIFIWAQQMRLNDPYYDVTFWTVTSLQAQLIIRIASENIWYSWFMADRYDYGTYTWSI